MNLHSIIRNRIHRIITIDLTDGRFNNNLEPFEINRITDIINKYSNEIDNIIELYVIDNENNQNIQNIFNPADDYLRDYLYEQFPEEYIELLEN